MLGVGLILIGVGLLEWFPGIVIKRIFFTCFKMNEICAFQKIKWLMV